MRAAIDGPLICSYQHLQPLPTMQELKEWGMCMASGVQISQQGYVGWWEILDALQRRGLDAWIEWREKVKDHPASWERVYDLVGFPKVREWEEKYLSKEQLEKYDKSSGLYEPR